VYLLDTNIFLEVLLNQEQCSVAKYILNRRDFNLFISDFSLYSIGIFLVRRKDFTAMSEFLNDIENRGVTITRLNTDDIHQVSDICSQFNLDFDDGYQYYTAEKNHLKIISFDHDFDKTPLGRINPSTLISE
jgi:uncharacterized protein